MRQLTVNPRSPKRMSCQKHADLQMIPALSFLWGRGHPQRADCTSEKNTTSKKPSFPKCRILVYYWSTTTACTTTTTATTATAAAAAAAATAAPAATTTTTTPTTQMKYMTHAFTWVEDKLLAPKPEFTSSSMDQQKRELFWGLPTWH